MSRRASRITGAGCVFRITSTNESCIRARAYNRHHNSNDDTDQLVLVHDGQRPLHLWVVMAYTVMAIRALRDQVMHTDKGHAGTRMRSGIRHLAFTMYPHVLTFDLHGRLHPSPLIYTSARGAPSTLTLIGAVHSDCRPISRSMPTANAENPRRSEGTERRASPETSPRLPSDSI